MSDKDVKLGYIAWACAPMAKRLVEWPGVTVFDVRTEAMTPLAEAGAALADSVADVAPRTSSASRRSTTSRCAPSSTSSRPTPSRAL